MTASLIPSAAHRPPVTQVQRGRTGTPFGPAQVVHATQKLIAGSDVSPPVLAGAGVGMLGDGRAMGRTGEYQQVILLAAQYDDIQAVRKATANRKRAALANGWPVEKVAQAFGDLIPSLTKIENHLGRQITKATKDCPLGDHVAATRGLGGSSLGKLLQHIGDPAWNRLHDRPRTFGELVKYCGIAGPDQRNHKGVQSNWNTKARAALHLIAAQMVKDRQSAYRHVYDEGRARYTNPDQSPAHQHNQALRLVKRAILKDIWTAAQNACDAKPPAGGGPNVVDPAPTNRPAPTVLAAPGPQQADL